MQRRSWMAALTLAAMVGVSARADEPTSTKQAGDSTPSKRGDDVAAPSVKKKIALNLRCTNLVSPGVVTVKPGSAACRFKSFSQNVDNKPRPAIPIEVEVFSADRDCSLLITLKEPGKPLKTVRRSFRIEPDEEGKPGPQLFECLVSAVPPANVATVAERPTDEPKTKN